MTEVAREAGVGKATVSLALRDDPRLRPETRARIQEVAERLGYRRNAVVATLMAQLRASKDPKYQATLGLLNAAHHRDELHTNATFRLWLKGLQDRCVRIGYAVDDFWLHDPGIEPARLGQILATRNIRGVIIAGVLEHREIPSRFDPLWEDLASVVVGVRPERPALHFACNDQFSTALHAADELHRLGYRRPGLVIAAEIESNIDYRFSAGFYAGPPRFEEQLPGWTFEEGGREAFLEWFRAHRPDVVVTVHPEVRAWLETARRRIPRDVGVIHLDVTTDLPGWSGMRQLNDRVGALAVDLVVGQLHRNEYGVPDHPRCIMVESEWVPGETVRPVSRSGRRAASRR